MGPFLWSQYFVMAFSQRKDQTIPFCSTHWWLALVICSYWWDVVSFLEYFNYRLHPSRSTCIHDRACNNVPLNQDLYSSQPFVWNLPRLWKRRKGGEMAFVHHCPVNTTSIKDRFFLNQRKKACFKLCGSAFVLM